MRQVAEKIGAGPRKEWRRGSEFSTENLHIHSKGHDNTLTVEIPLHERVTAKNQLTTN